MARGWAVGAGLVGLLAVVGAAWWLSRAPEPTEEERPRPSEPLPAPKPTRAEDRIASAQLPACAGVGEPAAIGGDIELRVFIGAGVDTVRAREAVSAAQLFWNAHQVEIHPAAAPIEIANTSMFVGSFDELDALGDDPEAIAGLLYRELRAFLREHAQPRTDEINLVIVRDIVHPRAAAASVVGDLVGLTLSPELLESDDPSRAAILDALALGEFEPTVLLSDRHLSRMSEIAFIASVAHELGHALGLSHHEERSNLMARGEHGCLPGLDEAQVAQLRARQG